jgi:hypothetical protein
MAHMSIAKGRSGRPRASMSLAILLSFIAVSAMAGQHSHVDSAESPTACAVCASTHLAPVSTAPPSEVLHVPPSTFSYSVDGPARAIPASAPISLRTRAPPVESLFG